MGIGNTASAALLVHRLAPAPLDECIGVGAGQDDAGMARKRAAHRQGGRAQHRQPRRSMSSANSAGLKSR